MTTTVKALTIIGHNLNGGYTSKCKQKDIVRASWCYLHGELEGLNGYDIFSLLKQELTSEQIDDNRLSDSFGEGMYPCLFKDKECTFFRWKDNTSRPHGLVVLNTDKVSYKDAERKFNLKISDI